MQLIRIRIRLTDPKSSEPVAGCRMFRDQDLDAVLRAVGFQSSEFLYTVHESMGAFLKYFSQSTFLEYH